MILRYNANIVNEKETQNIPQQEYSFKLDWSLHCILRLLSNYEFTTVLDIGSGEGEHKKFLQLFGKDVFSVDILKNADYVGDFLEIDFDKEFDVVWCSHVLEHQRNTGFFLDKIYDVLKENGILAITVPIHPRERLVSGHLSSWSAPLLCYNLIMAGFNCNKAEILSTYELSLLVRKELANHKGLRNSSAHGADAGVEFSDIAKYFPFPAKQGVELCGPGQINWGNPTQYFLPNPTIQVTFELKIECKNLDINSQLAPNLQFAARY
jgi:SAM-dependent methyltransferase